MKKISNSIREELTALADLPENMIDFSDIPSTKNSDWQGAVRGKFYRPRKQQLTVRIDSDVVDWLKNGGRGYQSRMNEILRDFMLRHIQHSAR